MPPGVARPGGGGVGDGGGAGGGAAHHDGAGGAGQAGGGGVLGGGGLEGECVHVVVGLQRVPHHARQAVGGDRDVRQGLVGQGVGDPVQGLGRQGVGVDVPVRGGRGGVEVIEDDEVAADARVLVRPGERDRLLGSAIHRLPVDVLLTVAGGVVDDDLPVAVRQFAVAPGGQLVLGPPAAAQHGIPHVTAGKAAGAFDPGHHRPVRADRRFQVLQRGVIGERGDLAGVQVLHHELRMGWVGGVVHPGDGASADGRGLPDRPWGGVQLGLGAAADVVGVDLRINAGFVHVDDRGAADTRQQVLPAVGGHGGVLPSGQVVVPDLETAGGVVGVGDPVAADVRVGLIAGAVIDGDEGTVEGGNGRRHRLGW